MPHARSPLLFQVLLHIAGVSNSGRFKYLLGCGSPVVAFDLPGHRYKEWWFGLLQNGTNVRQGGGCLPWWGVGIAID